MTVALVGALYLPLGTKVGRYAWHVLDVTDSHVLAQKVWSDQTRGETWEAPREEFERAHAQAEILSIFQPVAGEYPS